MMVGVFAGFVDSAVGGGGLLEEEDRGEVIDNPPEDGETGYESLIRFNGKLVAGPGPMVTWWLLTLPICAYVQIPTRTDDEEE